MNDNYEDLIAEARETFPALFRAPGARDLLDRMADALEASDARLREAEDAAIGQNELNRELGNALREAEAVIEQVRAKLPGPRTFAESMSRDFAGNLWPRNVDADEIAAILATYKTTTEDR